MVTDGIAQKRFEELRRIFTAGKASHAYLFLGSVNQENEDGIQGLAQILLCQAEGEKPCGTCRACRLLTGGSHPDFRVIAPEGGKIKLEEIRQLCYDAVLNPYLSPCKVYLFKRFETLTEVAANAFLKTLEEPPPAVYFLALAEQELGVLPTIRSRMQRVQLGGVLPQHGFGAADGTDLHVSDLSALWRQAQKLSSQDREQVDLFLQGLQTQLRTKLMTAIQAGTAPVGLMRGIAAVQQSRAYTAANVNLRLLLEDLLLTLFDELGEMNSPNNN
ncbi:MAG TPA: hypothetical protein DDZ55_11730 [Firmicutes bacterium]|nr:hypothetical protein [Bacillota bacterium]